MEKKVSVIIPFYNGVDWLCEAVQSALDQTYKNLEIIVINDGSPENVDDFLKKYGDKIIYKYKKNGGPASARNLAMQIATGDYFAFLDSDDVWLPDKTKKQIAFMEQCNAMWSHTGFYYWKPENNSLKTVDIYNNYDDVYLQSFVSLKISTPSIVINKKCFEEHPEFSFPQNMRYGQDSKLFQMLSKYYPIALLCEPLMKIRLRGTNTNTRALIRISLKSSAYYEIKQNTNNEYERITPTVKFIYSIYALYDNFFIWIDKKIKVPYNTKEFLAKCLWSIPFIIERIYVKYIVFKNKKNKKYRLDYKSK